MQTETSLVGSDRGVKLYTESIVYLYLTLVIHPGNTKQDLTLRRNKTLQKRISSVLFLVCFDHDS